MRRAPTTIRYPDLPVTERKDELLATIGAHQVEVVAGETGSGKSTQLPKLCLELGRGLDKLIGHTQPRRLAARTIAERVAEELGETVGQTVGYTVRFTDKVGPDTAIKVMTDGILLAEIQRDPELTRYDTLIVDEAHERSLNVDFLLGYLKQLLPRRPDLKLVITSATIDTERFSKHFDDAPVVAVSGRTYPVEVRYRDPADEDEPDPVQAIIDAVEELSHEGPGDVLVFLSGEREIRDTADALRALELRHTEILPLYARLTAAEQHRVFQPHTGRRVVLATNVAETSLTVPGIRYVVDPGTARISRYNRRTKVQRLPIEPVSQASANQRAGRCGRVAPGICIRLYAEEDFAGRPEFTEPEILRTNLASVILQMTSLGLGDMQAFPFVEPPDARSIKDGVELLEELGALDEGRLTRLGRKLAQLPLDPRLGRMVLEAERHGCTHEVMVIAAALSIQDPRERPRDEKRQRADELHRRFVDESSDFLTYLNLWEHLRDRQKHLSSNQFRRECKSEFLHFMRIREWQDIYSQLLQVTRSMRIKVNRTRSTDSAIHLSLLAGLLSHVGMRDEERRDYLGARNARFAISGGSVLAKKQPRWAMAGELVETNRLWAHTVARIQPEWVERVGGHLVQRTYSEPHWERASGSVQAYERVTLYGLPIVTNRRVNVAKLDPALARELFIRHALVEGDWETHHGFLAHNHALADEVRALEDRARRRDLLLDDEGVFTLYDARVPADIGSGRAFERWVRREQPDLAFTVDDLITTDARISARDYPDVWRQGELELPLTYVFDPSAEDDGVTVHVPIPVLHRLEPGGFDWHVPGQREELVTALVRILPKALRRELVPAPDHARAALERIEPGDGPLLEVLATELSRQAGAVVLASAFDLEQLPPHLRVGFLVHDDRGRPIEHGKDLALLQRRLHGRLREAVAHAGRALARTGQQAWTFGTIARQVEIDWAGHPVTGYPTLVDEGTSVGLEVVASPDDQAAAMWRGTRRLLLLTNPSPKKALRDRLTNRTKVALGHAPHAGFAELLDDCITCAVDGLLAQHGGPAWEEDGFEQVRLAVRGELGDRAVGVVAAVGRILDRAHAIQERLRTLSAPSLLHAVVDVEVQLSRLVFPGFVTATGAARLPDLLRYLEAIEHRLAKLPEDPGRDRELTGRIRKLEDELVRVPKAQDVARLRRTLEELRVSLFAQHLGTAHRVSEPRVQREIEEAARRPRP
jgi:ATP-dependent helicase HrpA